MERKEKRHKKNIRRRKEKQSIINNNINHTDIRRLAKVCKYRSMNENSQNGHFATFSMPNWQKMTRKFLFSYILYFKNNNNNVKEVKTNLKNRHHFENFLIIKN